MINEKVFHSLLSRFQIGVEPQMRGSDFIFDCANLLYYKCHKTICKSGGLHIDSANWITEKKATISPKNNNDNFFKFAATNLEKIFKKS